MSPHSSSNISESWFRASEAMGDGMDIPYGRINLQTGEIEWLTVSHCDCDGIGAFAKLLREQGESIPELPKTKKPHRGIISPLLKLILNRESDVGCAKRCDWLLENPEERNRPENIAWHLFNTDETRAILDHCRKDRVSVNSFLLHGLDQSIRSEITHPEKKVTWMIPVNLRGDIQEEMDTQNHVSCVELKIAPEDNAHSIQKQITVKLDRGEHRANYLLLLLGGVMSHRAKVNFLTKDRAKPTGNIGAFSNLGAWRPSPSSKEQGWVFCPPIVTGQRLAAGCVTYQGRLGLATQGGPAAERMNRWVTRIQEHTP